MCMKLYRNLYCFLNRRNKLCSCIRKQKSCHIFKADRVCTHIFNLLCNVYPVVHRIGITQRIRKRYLCMAFFLICSCYGCFQISEVIHTVKDTDNINSVCYRLLYKILYHIIRIWTVSKDILPTEKHLKLCVLKAVTELTKPLPRVFFQETQGSIECSAAPALYRMVAYFVHLINDWKHLLRRHTCSNQRLMRITQDCLCNLNRFFLILCHF